MMKKALITVAALLSITLLGAQTTSGTQGETLTLSLDQAIEIALNDNPTIMIANMEIERQDYVRKETVGNLLPGLSATGSYVYAIKKQEMAPGLSFGADNTISTSLDLSVPLFVPAVYATLKMNRAQMESAVESARASKLTLTNSVKKAYYNILLAQQSLEVLLESAKLTEETVLNATAMAQSGLAAEYDKLTAEVQLANLQPNIIQTRNGLELAKLQLKMYLSIPETVQIEVEGDLDSLNEEVFNSGTTYSTNLTYNSDLRSLDIQARILEGQLKQINAQRMPTLAAFGQYSPTATDIDLTGLGFSSSGGLTWQQPINVGVQISIPIFSGLKTNRQAKQMKNAMSQLELQRDYTEQGLKLEVQSSINNIIAAREKMVANEKATVTAQKAYDISNARYQAGAGTILELNSSQLSLTQAQLNYSQAIFDYLAAEADYEKTIGRDY